DIYVKSVETVNEGFHARFSAKSKVYRYVFLRGYDPLLRNRVYSIDCDLSVEEIGKSLKVFIGKHNFEGFSSDERDNKVCTIYDISLSRVENFFYFEVEGDRFLRKMVRFMAGAVLMLAEGKITEGDIKMSLNTGKKIKDLTPLPPYALYLLWVKY
ncbi:MAG: tRNA pseudouridine(38-40) synthase TruA, partial [candidate division WOR-3 bacterium]